MLSKLCSCIHEIKKIIQENVKNCTVISHFASSPDHYRGFALDHIGERKSEADLEEPSRLRSPFGRRIDAVTQGTHDMCGVGRSAGSTHFPHPSPLPFHPSLPFSFPNYTAGNLEIHSDLL